MSNMADTGAKLALAKAIVDGHLSVVEMLVESGVNCQGVWCPDIRVNKDGDTFLHVAVACEKTDIVKFFIEEAGVDVDERCGRGDTSLHRAARFGFYEIVKLLVQNGADCNAVDNEGITPCHHAAMKGFVGVIQYLVKQGKADINKRDTESGMSPFHIAAAYVKDVLVLKQLIDLGADFNARIVNDRCALRVAASLANLNAIKFLVEGKYLDPNECDEVGYNLLHFVLIYPCDERWKSQLLLEYPCEEEREKLMRKMIEYLVKEQKVDLNKAVNDGITPVHLACQYRDLQSLKLLIDEGADYTACSDDGNSLLHKATLYADVDVVEYLTKKMKLDVNGRNTGGQTPLHFACVTNDLDSVKLFLDNGADLNAVADDGRGCLHFGGAVGATDVVKYLVEEKKMDVNKGAAEGVMPLHSAAGEGHLELCKLFVNLGADYVSRDMNGNSVLHYAAREGHANVLKYFIEELGQDVKKCRNKNGATPLHVACESDTHLNCVKLLVENGANYTLLDNEGRSCLSYAETPNGKVCRYLMGEKVEVDVRNPIGISPVVTRTNSNSLADEADDCKTF